MDYDDAMLGFKHFQLAYTAVKIGLPKLLGKGPRTAPQLAESTGVPRERLVRLLNGLVWCEVLKTLDDGSYALAPSGSELVDDRPNSLSDDLRFQGEFLYRAFGEMHGYLIDGSVPFERAHGVGIFDCIAGDPELARLYAFPMAQRCTEYSDVIARHPALNEARMIVDVAGGTGQLLIDVLKFRSDARGTVFDLPYMRDQAVVAITAADLEQRCRFEAGDFFRSIPAGADVYLLKWILHDFDDAQALAILRNLAIAMTDRGKLLIIERLLPERISAETGLIQGDLNMLCLSGGAERTLEQYRALCAAAGLTLGSSTQIETAYGFHLMEVRR